MIDNQAVNVPVGATLLDAARRLGIDVPTLCWQEGCRPNTTCMVCLMKIEGADRLVPSCATVAEDGLCVESETDEVRQARRTALELLLSDHAGECRAPCQYADPFDTDVPGMMRQIAVGRIEEAAATVREAMPFAAVLARLGPDVYEGGCRRGAVDEPAGIGLLKRYVADWGLASARDGTPARRRCHNAGTHDAGSHDARSHDAGTHDAGTHSTETGSVLPPRDPASGKRVVVVGGGPAGLSAAYFLSLRGHACTVYETHKKAGGMLLDVPPAQLSPNVLDAEIALLVRLGVRFELNTMVGRTATMADLRRDFDAVLVAAGRLDQDAMRLLGLAGNDGRLQVSASTHETEADGVFAAGDVVRPRGQALRAAADGKAAAYCIDQYLRGGPVTGLPRLATLRLSRPGPDELAAMAADASSAGRVEPNGGPGAGLTDEEACAEARRCLSCDCEKLDGCRLRRYAEAYGADASRYRGPRRRTQRLHPHPDITFQSGKCILCGLCIQIAKRAGEPLGLTFAGRGFEMRVTTPFDASLAEALKDAARECAEACPTGALALRGMEAKPPCQSRRI